LRYGFTTETQSHREDEAQRTFEELG